MLISSHNLYIMSSIYSLVAKNDSQIQYLRINIPTAVNIMLLNVCIYNIYSLNTADRTLSVVAPGTTAVYSH
jgi:hypothetical protein